MFQRELEIYGGNIVKKKNRPRPMCIGDATHNANM